MRKPLCSLTLTLLAISQSAPVCLSHTSAETLKQQERSAISLELEFAKKNPNPFQRVISFLNWGPNGYATGFQVGGRLVMTAYHVVSGELDESKKIALGFGRDDALEVKVFVGGCQAKVVKADPEADLALLEVCSTSKQSIMPALETTLAKDEKLMMVARPHGDRIVSRGTFYGAYAFKGIEYWSAKIAARDGFSGSPVYNEQGKLVGIFSGYDWSQKLAVVSPGIRAQKLIDEFTSTNKP